MDTFEASRAVYSRIHNLDPENASKIMGYILIQDDGEKEVIRLAFGPEALLRSLILKAKSDMGIPTSSNPPPTSLSRPTPLSIPSNSSSFSSNTWPSHLNHCLISPPVTSSDPSLSYANVVNENGASVSSSASSRCISEVPNQFNIDDYHFQDHLSFLPDSAATKPEGDNLYAAADSPLLRRSFSVPPGLCFGAEDVNSWQPCLYFAKGSCKNGTGCKFVHGDCTDIAASPTGLNDLDQYQELFRSKALLLLQQQQQQLQQQQQQQKIAAASQLMASASSPYSKYANFILQQNNDTHW